ncbi:MAG: rod shape-determining protein MreC [Steroidobacteraceae bacterium]|nr:rod shape-determining protein MreC [Steroidobacteraceae bacterium]MDW8258103.1 rod shape-determining protein MreC [Gammaproteobacteria bacterium]
MYLDQRGGWLESARFALQAAAYPLQVAVNSPSVAWRWVESALQSRRSLQRQNARLRRENTELKLRLLHLQALESENARLRNLAQNLPPLTQKWLAAEIISSELTRLRQRFVINRGSNADVFKGQTVVGAGGLLGQTMRVGPFSSEVILITDPEHATPVQVLRNGLRTIAVGTGDTALLALPYLPVQSDIEIGDQLVTSGLGGVFPAGYPVAIVTRVDRAAGGPLAVVEARAVVAVDSGREVALLWFTAENPAAPARDVAPPAPAPAGISEAAR